MGLTLNRYFQSLHAPWQSVASQCSFVNRNGLPILVLSLLSLVSACASLPPSQTAVDKVKVEGNQELSGSDIKEKLATTQTPRFLGLFEGVLIDYEVFDRYVLQRDLERVERYYRARGFYEAHARAARVVYTKANHVSVTIAVDEGLPVQVREVKLEGLTGLPQADVTAALAAAQAKLPQSTPFDEEGYAAAEGAVKRTLTDLGYAFAQVKHNATVDLPGHFADVAFEVTPGEKATLGPITIDGLGPLPEAPVRRAIDLKPGAPYSTSDIDSARQSVLDLGVFSSVNVEPQLDDTTAASHVVPLQVHVTPSRLHSVQLGGGVELDVIRTDLHLQTRWEDHNFLGGLRHFLIEFKPGVVLYPTRLPNLQAPNHVLPEEKLRAELRQPGFLEARTAGTLRSEFNVYPVLWQPQVDPKAPVVGYREFREAAGVDRTLWKFYASTFYNLQVNSPFSYIGLLDPELRGVVISYLDLFTHVDFRDDKVHPHKGLFVGNDLQLAGGFLGGNAHDTKVQPEVRAYVPIVDKVTVALRGSVGFLFPYNYGNTLASNASNSALPPGFNQATWDRDVQLVYFRGFFSGGPSSNRGYPLRGVGPHGVVPFFNPGIAAQQLAQHCDQHDPQFDAARCALPLGGLSLWEASAEFRFPIEGALSGATFCDTSDVSTQKVNVRLNRPHLSCGFGLRYDTPVGPVRLDLGYRIPGMQVIGQPIDLRQEGDPGKLFGIPMAVAFGIGEAFLWRIHPILILALLAAHGALSLWWVPRWGGWSRSL